MGCELLFVTELQVSVYFTNRDFLISNDCTPYEIAVLPKAEKKLHSRITKTYSLYQNNVLQIL